MNEEDLGTKIQELPEDLKREVLDYIDFLINKYKIKKRKLGSFEFDWEDGLSELQKEFNSVELQHKSMEWR